MQILSGEIKKSVAFCFRSLGFKNIAFSDGLSWKIHRRILISALRQHISNTAFIEERVTYTASKLLRFLEEQQQKDFDPADFLNQCIVEVLGRIIFGNDWDLSDPQINDLIHRNELGLKSYKDFQAMMFLDFFPLSQLFPFSSRKKIFGIFLSTLEIIRLKLRERMVTFDP